MTPEELKGKLDHFMELTEETEWVEFKEARNDFDFDDMGRYFSALSNEANLNSQSSGWLVFGMTNKPPRQIVGTSFRHQSPGLERLKQQIARETNHQLTFSHIHELVVEGKRVILFQIPPAPRGIITTWRGHAYGRIHESLSPLSLYEIEQIRRQAPQEDWSVHICEGATLDDLNPDAITFARKEYKKKHNDLTTEVDQWDDTTFLNKAKVSIGGQVTRAAIILLGRAEAEHFISPAVARITWVLRDEGGNDKDYQHFGPPLLLAVGQVFDKVRNLTYRYLPDASLFPTEVSKYDPWVIREALHNAIAHQDYTKAGKITVVEEPEAVLFTTAGSSCLEP